MKTGEAAYRRVRGGTAAVVGSLVLAGNGCSGSEGPPPEAVAEYSQEVYRPDSLLARYPPAGSGLLVESALGIAVDEDAVYLMDMLGGRILRFPAGDDPPLAIGRPGQGPGELDGPAAVRLGPEGDVWVSSPNAARISRFRPDGEIVQEYRSPYPVVNFTVTDGARLLIPTLDAASLLAELHPSGDTSVLEVEGPLPGPLGRRPLERLHFQGFMMADAGNGRLVLLRNKNAEAFDLWVLSLTSRGAIGAVERLSLPRWFYELLAEETKRLRRELSEEFATGDFDIPFKGLHVVGTGRVSLTPSASNRILAMEIPLASDAPARIVIPSPQREYVGLVDALVAGDRLVALYETEARVYSLAPTEEDGGRFSSGR